MDDQTKKIRYSYFPGCASKQMAGDYDKSTRIACEKLGIKLIDIPEFNCCGAGVIKEADSKFNEDLNERNFKLSESKNVDIMTICSTCVINLRKDLIHMQNKGKFEDFNVKHLLWVLEEDLGWEKLKKQLKKPLNGLKIATFYGCHILRPSKYVGQHQEAENPYNFEEFVEVLGAKPVDLPGKVDCCGFHINMYNQKASVQTSDKYLKEAVENKADFIITNCPFCHMQFDLYQKKYKIPILHMSQVLCLALGVDPKKIGLKKGHPPF